MVFIRVPTKILERSDTSLLRGKFFGLARRLQLFPTVSVTLPCGKQACTPISHPPRLFSQRRMSGSAPPKAPRCPPLGPAKVVTRGLLHAPHMCRLVPSLAV